MPSRPRLRRTLLMLAVLASVPLVPTRAEAIMGGRLATQPYPYMTALFFDNSFGCGGSLVAPQWVLTAAHCIFEAEPDRFLVAFGKSTLIGEVGVSRIALVNVHEIYPESEISSHDVALLKLEKPVDITPLRIADPDIDTGLWAPGEQSRVIGYGGQMYPGLLADGNLREVDVPMVSDADCQNSYTLTGDFDATTMVCAGEIYGTKDSCQGDSGGPLMVPDETDEFVQVGVVSWGFGCGIPTQYGVYSRVADRELYDWIMARIGPRPPPPGTITGSVIDAEAKSLAGAKIRCGESRTRTDGKGSFVVSQVAVATYTCTATKRGYQDARQVVTIVPAQTAKLDFTLTQ